MSERLAQQIAFLVEADKLKSVIRRTRLVDTSRLENSAEHSWHLVLAAMVLREYAPARIDWMRVVEMVAVHDLVEIDAGDVSAYDEDALAAKAERERLAADRIFGLLPPDLGDRFRRLWDDFEAQETDDAKFANALDRLQPLLQNEHSGGGSWCRQTLADRQILRRMAPIETAMPGVWPHVLDVVEAFCRAGVLQRTRE
jgi:putative hydrolase of HD superfamily